MHIVKRARLIVLGSALLLSNALHPQSSPQVKRTQVDWQTFKSSQISDNAPAYPPLAVATRIEGVVLIDFVVSTDGMPKDLVVVSGHPLLVQSAIEAVRTWRFKPSVVGETAVEVETVASVNFFLPGHDASTILAPHRKDVERHPNDAKRHITLGLTLLSLGQPKDAAEQFRKAISLEPQEAQAHFHLGKALAAEGELDAGISEYGRGLSMKPGDTNAHYDLADLLQRNGDLDGAISEYRLGLQLQPKEANRHYGLGLLLMKKKDWDGAIAEYKLSLHGGYDNPWAHFQIGRAFEEKGDLAAALNELQRAAKDMPQNETFRQARDRVASASHP